MPVRQILQLVNARPLAEGAGVVVHRTIGTPSLKNFDPFLMLDHFGSDNPDQYIAGFPDHPHRGFITLTYMLDGRMQHRDSMGNEGNLSAGGIQWMKAASGVIHSEMPKQSNGLMRGFQLWINLPAAQKMSAPAYQEFSANAIPTVESAGTKIKIICGALGDVHGPITDDSTKVFYFDVSIEPNITAHLDVPATHQCFVYCFEGAAQIESLDIPEHSLATLDRGEILNMSAGPRGARLIVAGGLPLNEPIVQYGPFVMNSREEIETAIADYHAGKLVQSKAAFITDAVDR